MYYILKGHKPVLESNLYTWGMWFQDADRRVTSTDVGGAQISTVFLGIDHQFGVGIPILFETLVFGGGDSIDGKMER